MCKGPLSTRARMNALYVLLSVNLRRALCGRCVVLLFQVRKLRHRGNIELAHIHSERPANSEPKPNAVYTKSGVCILHVLSLTGSRSSCLRVKTFMLGCLPSVALSCPHEDSRSSDRILGQQLVCLPGAHHCSLLNSPPQESAL